MGEQMICNTCERFPAAICVGGVDICYGCHEDYLGPIRNGEYRVIPNLQTVVEVKASKWSVKEKRTLYCGEDVFTGEFYGLVHTDFGDVPTEMEVLAWA